MEEAVLRRFVAKFTMSADPNGCWLWQGSLRHGYGRFRIAPGMVGSAHRLAYEHWRGPIPAGQQLDHQCHTATCPDVAYCVHRRCVNPVHLEPASNRQNSLRGRSVAAQNAQKDQCPKGHPYSPENTLYPNRGGRLCRECKRLASERYNRCHTEEQHERYRRRVGPKVAHADKTQCPQGHPYDGANTIWYKGRRFCRECGRQATKRYMARRKS